MKNPEQGNAWSEREPFLAFEVNFGTLPGYAWNNDWRSRTDAKMETDLIAGSNAVLTRCTSVASGHMTRAFSYFRCGDGEH